MDIYVVRTGDTMAAIARQYGVSLGELLDLNRLPDPAHLVVGQAILIPARPLAPLRYRTVAGDTLFQLATLFGTGIPELAAANRLANPAQINPGTTLIIPGWSQFQYTVAPGDTLYQIARRFGVSTAALVRVNQPRDGGQLYPGQRLLIPQRAPRRPAIVTLGYFQTGTWQDLGRTLAEIGPLLTYAAIFQFPAAADGTVRVPEPAANMVNLFRDHRIQPLPVITNWGPAGFDSDLARAILGNQAVKARLIENIAALLRQYGFAGVNIDFENMYPADRPLYTDFVRDLARALKPQGYLVTLAVAPKFADLPDQPWVGAFDYAALGQLADLIYLMTYEWGWIGGPPMAVAPLNQVRRVLNYAAGLIPAAKILQGIPLYGYDWPLPHTPDRPARTVDLLEVYPLAYRRGAVINYDPVAQSPWFHYRAENGAPHEVWFEDARSVRAKYETARDLRLRGVGFWSYLNAPYGFSQNWALLGEMFAVVKG